MNILATVVPPEEDEDEETDDDGDPIIVPQSRRADGRSYVLLTNATLNAS